MIIKSYKVVGRRKVIKFYRRKNAGFYTYTYLHKLISCDIVCIYTLLRHKIERHFVNFYMDSETDEYEEFEASLFSGTNLGTCVCVSHMK